MSGTVTGFRDIIMYKMDMSLAFTTLELDLTIISSMF